MEWATNGMDFKRTRPNVPNDTNFFKATFFSMNLLILNKGLPNPHRAVGKVNT